MNPSLETILSLLRYIYCAEVSIKPENFSYLFEASRIYNFTNDHLKTLIKQNLNTNVTFDSVINILEVSCRLKEDDVKNIALNFIEKNLKVNISKNNSNFNRINAYKVNFLFV